MLFAAWIAWETKTVVSRFNESKWIGLIIYTLLIIGVTIVPIVLLLKDSPIVVFIIRSIATIFAAKMVVVLLFVPKIYLVLFGQVSPQRLQLETREFIKKQTDKKLSSTSMINSKMSNMSALTNSAE